MSALSVGWAQPGTQIGCNMSFPFLRSFLLVAIAVAAQVSAFAVHASTITWWTFGQSGTKYATWQSAISAEAPQLVSPVVSKVSGTPPALVTYQVYANPDQNGVKQPSGYVYFGTTECPFGNTGLQCNTECSSPYSMVGGQCVPPSCSGDSTWNGTACALVCQPPSVPNYETNTCNGPGNCPVGSSWDFDNNRCAYPQDDQCGAHGAQWNPQSQQCDCAEGKVLVINGAISTCMVEAPDQECTADSADFSGYVGYQGVQTAVCAGRNRCPDGSKPGFAGTGDNVTAVCAGAPDPNCPDGQPGIYQGKYVCLSHPGQDPRCALNETPGYVGIGNNKEFQCLPGDYGKKPCPPGQVLSFFGGAKSCVVSTGKETGKNPDGTPQKPGQVAGSVGGSGGDGGNGGAGGDAADVELDFSSFFEGAPRDDFFKDLDEFGDSALEGIDTDSMVGEFAGDDGAFTQRSSLENAADFVVSRTIGNGASCSGSMPFFGFGVPCEKLAKMNSILGWFIFVGTLYLIFGVLTRPSASGV